MHALYKFSRGIPSTTSCTSIDSINLFRGLCINWSVTWFETSLAARETSLKPCMIVYVYYLSNTNTHSTAVLLFQILVAPQ